MFVVMGVSGSGKSTVARSLAGRLEAALLDGDFLHPRANVLKMASGQPLDDADRAPWLASLNDAIFAMRRTNQFSIVICSALKRKYRDRLRIGNEGLRFIYLKGTQEVIAARMQARGNHFFRPEMLASQFVALEEPTADETDVWAVNIDQPLAGLVDAVVLEIESMMRSTSGF